MSTRLIALAALALFASGASAQIASSDSRSTSDIEALYWSRLEASKQGTQADADFMSGMIGHHAQALILADMAERNGASRSIQTLAARIDNAQRDEIATMQRWLRDRDRPWPEVSIDGLTLTITMNTPTEEPAEAMDHSQHSGMDHGEMNHEGMDHGDMDHGEMDHGAMAHDHSSMPGMLSDAQLAELDAARGAEFDRLFLAYMIQHHQGAITMVDDLIATDGAVQDEQAFRLAADIRVDQVTEIARMKLMLEELED